MATILVTDDSKFMRLMLKRILESNGHQVIAEAGNGREAIEMYSLLSPELVTLDITMPEVDGLQAVKEICSRDPKAKVIMISSMGQQYMILEAMNYGASDYIVKPFDLDRLYDAVNRVLR